MSKKRKTASKMTTAELAKATADLGEENVIDTFGPPPPEAKAQWARARGKCGRPKKGRGIK